LTDHLKSSAAGIEGRARFDFVRYANCWEDADILCEALQPSAGKRLLSIMSAGDNAFALAAEGAEVIACDLNPAQLACAELKAKSIRLLSYEDVLAFFGIHDNYKRIDTYNKIRPNLSSEARSFWDERTNEIEKGFIHHGKFEKYFSLFRRYALPLIAGNKKIEQLFEERSLEERQLFYDERWNTWRWRLLFKTFFNRFVMGKLGRDPEFFRYVEGSVSDRLLKRAEQAFRELPATNNPFLSYILTGNYTKALPRYLRVEHFSKVRDGLDRINFVIGPIQQVARDHKDPGFDGFNLSDIFEYMDEDLCTEIYGSLLSTARKGARFAYWNMLVPRHCPLKYANVIEFLEELSGNLFHRDMAFFYSAFRVEEVKCA